MDLNWEFSTLVDGKVAGSNPGYFSSNYKTMLRWLDQHIILWSQEETTMDDHLSAQCQVIDMDDDRLMQICNSSTEGEVLSALELAAIDELSRRGVVKGVISRATVPISKNAAHT